MWILELCQWAMYFTIALPWSKAGDNAKIPHTIPVPPEPENDNLLLPYIPTSTTEASSDEAKSQTQLLHVKLEGVMLLCTMMYSSVVRICIDLSGIH
ncbi:hypothetical protein CDV31_003522 [Fusarium ambrosium]|uniref:Uncharacterized protein n=1 Tax=Fusarium ambrosium TaxID=131363 RepID=A0A428UTL8_9HYPO|nr:hypothetical protein CDV31_003522 [Fusarium ambrosium]